MTDTLTVQLMFQGRASDALDLYATAIAPFELLGREHSTAQMIWVRKVR